MTKAAKHNLLVRAKLYALQLFETLGLHRAAYLYIRENRPWQGLNQYGWTVKFLLGGAILIGFYFFVDLVEAAKKVVDSPEAFGANMALMFTDFSLEKFDWAFSGGKKYLVLIVLEIVTFHFVQHTLEKRTGREPDHTFKAFLKAEKRMVKVAIISWVIETLARIVVNIPLGILGLSILEEPVGYAIQFYFVGFALIDNYHECFDLTVKESRFRTRRVTGVALATGAVAYVLMFVPMVGVLAASMLGAVTATMSMERFGPVKEGEVLYLKARRKKKK